MQLTERGVRIEIGKERRVKPLRQLLDGDEVVRTVIELMPDGVKRAVPVCLDAGISRPPGIGLELACGFRQICARPYPDPAPVRHESFPVGARHDHLVGVGGHHLFGIELAEGPSNDTLRDIVAARHLDELAEVLVSEAQAAVLRVSANAFDEHLRARRPTRVDDAGDAPDLRGTERDKRLCPRFPAEQLADEAHGRLRVLHGIVTEIDVHDGHAKRVELLDVACVLGGPLCFDIHQGHIGLERNGLLDVERAVFKAAERGDAGDPGKLAQVSGIRVRIRLDQILPPADHTLNRIFRVERRNQIKLAPFPQDPAAHRHVHLDLASKQIGHRGQGGRALTGSGRCHPCPFQDHKHHGENGDPCEREEHDAPATLHCHDEEWL
jgi:hypothetical protein